jgi:hypothetical protein
MIYLIGDIAEFKKNDKDNTRRNLLIAGGLLGAGVLGTVAVKSYLRNGKLVRQSTRTIIPSKTSKKIEVLDDPWDGTVEQVTKQRKRQNKQTQQPVLSPAKEQLLLVDAGKTSGRVRRKNQTKPIPSGQLTESKQIDNVERVIGVQPRRTSYYGGKSKGYYQSPYPNDTKKFDNWEKGLERRDRLGRIAHELAQIQPTPENRKLRNLLAQNLKSKANEDKLKNIKRRVFESSDELWNSRRDYKRANRKYKEGVASNLSQSELQQLRDSRKVELDKYKGELKKVGTIRKYKTTGKKQSKSIFFG